MSPIIVSRSKIAPVIPRSFMKANCSSYLCNRIRTLVMVTLSVTGHDTDKHVPLHILPLQQ